jgi:flagellar basal-body rod protein FlgC
MDLVKTLRISAAGMQAQGTRMRTISENLANADSLPTEPGASPYRRKMVTFKNVLDKQVGAEMVKADKVIADKSDFQKKYDPSHPAADAEGYVQTPNVNSLIEVMDLRQAQRSYEANLSVIETSKTMLLRTIDLLRG